MLTERAGQFYKACPGVQGEETAEDRRPNRLRHG